MGASRVPEAARKIEVLASADVVVAGGGVAGCAAAVAATRAGARTVLLERFGYLGGLATGGLVIWYVVMDDGKGRVVAGGLASEFLRRTEDLGGVEALDPAWREGRWPESGRLLPAFSPEAAKRALDEVVVESGAEIVFHVLAADPIIADGRIAALAVETKCGRYAIKGRFFVDATGDADLAVRAGAPVAESENTLSCWFRVGGVPGAFGPMTGLALGLFGDPDGPSAITGMDVRALSKWELDARAAAWRRLEEMKRERPGWEGAYILDTPTQPDVRRTRRIRGLAEVGERDAGGDVAGCIGLAADWRHENSPPGVWRIPYRALVPRAGPANLLAAGRCVSAEGGAWDVLRVIAPCAVTGEAAGLAAALLAREDAIACTDLDEEKLRAGLAEAGAVLD